ncbi:G patch domain-containing 4 [Chlorella sorokiniana]|uniref:G patch domain-containing 4 n=1 Tax=Chlorella sorokiniana TaxID=3076 RepID=A0A2P6TQT6_CHLSO|nr:G patch domain-containing 4 [Chlorella sorokiniana]|eukprot:PRW56427.1 G patch domain-containing 4 [Chlorella sorokiniana]
MKLPPGHVAGLGVAKPKVTGGFGERLMRTMGWEAGQGLGKDGTGIKEAIQVKKKEDTVGVGGNGSYAWGDKWWEKAFDSAVQTVDHSDSSDSSDSDSDDEHYAAIAAAVNRDGTRTSASADELKLLAALNKGTGRVAAGRFGGRDAKMARIREQEAKMAAEAAAKLGVPSAGTTSVAAGTTGRKGSDASDTTSEARVPSSKKRGTGSAAAGDASEGAAASSVKSGKSSKKEGKKSKRRKEEAAAAAGEGAGEPTAASQQQQQGEATEGQPPKKQRIVIEPAVAQSGPVHAFVPTPATGWWGEKRFVSVGCLEGLDKTAAEAARRRMTFNEDDQAAIYNRAQAKKTQGKVGLGQGTGTVKVGGVKWEGKKVTFEEPEGGAEAEAAEETAAAGATGARLTAIGSCTQLDTLGQQGAQQAQQAQQEDDGWAAQVKWKKIIAAQLQGAEGQQLKLKQLQRQVVEAVLAKHSSLVSSKAAVKAAFAARLEGSSKFVVEGKLVRLRS